ncbi:SpvB/TcaC N-terminal domain-containing protein [Paraburkholderia sediminicola]|uniref:SpvB/TcaC N-terminal domain-containing protein n=1 Tax=Paraburkholderia rhynchosiae TaxID=487049 RepID=A0ACC7NNI5_9BURK
MEFYSPVPGNEGGSRSTDAYADRDTAASSSGPPSPFTAPAINLPKGGGAIRGIDEKFTTNPATGTGAISIPLALSAGRNAFGPQIALTYDSGSGNGHFGIGWSLSAPRIAIRTDKGLPRYRSAEESDIFVLSGAEDLVPELSSEECGEMRFVECEREGYCVRRYRPRVEGLFARIERWTCLETGISHWRSISRANVLTVYGFDADSRIADPDDPAHVFSWLICRSYDDRGNAIVYEYRAEDDCGVDTGRPSERSRSRTANRYLKRIRYGNRVPLLIDPAKPRWRASHIEPNDLDDAGWMFEAVFDYGEDHRTDCAPDENGRVFCRASTEPQSAWTVRRDSFSSYRSGFEIRTHRLCQGVLMFHRFERELGIPAALVRSMRFHYREKAIGSFLERVTAFGHRLLHDGRYLTRSLAPADFFYTESPLEDAAFDAYALNEVQPDGLQNLPAAIGAGDYRFVDLDGEGIVGILAEQDDTWFYKPNRGDGQLGAVETVSLRPSTANLGSGQQLMDLAGDGTLDVVELSNAGGFYERTDDQAWEGFRPFDSLPVQDWNDPNLRFVDLTGDGIADVLITEDDAFTWHRSLGEHGFAKGIRVAVPLDEERGPRVIFGDGTQSVYLADMTGDGLSDLVRIRNGEICYWPNLGHGRFGAKVAMENAPWFDDADLFDQKRLRLADTDGSGTTDVVYFGHRQVQVYLNETGDRWTDVRKVRAFPRIDDLASVTVTDFLGRGTACLLWSSSLPGDFGRHIRYVDLMCGLKPHLLARTVNNLGAETRIGYASSTRFYLADKAAGAPWITRLPFPVHVVDRVETLDHVSRNRFISRFSYHHGFYDGEEREFRGFGRVDQLDTEEIGTFEDGPDSPQNLDPASSIPPVLTRTWFHTGVFVKGGRVSRHLAREYYRESAAETLLDDTVLPPELEPEQAREACRALKGSMLRQEIYALDGKPESCRPYSATESNLTVRLIQPRGPNRHAVVYSHPREQLSLAYERKLYEVEGCLHADPRVSHNVTLEVDAYGNVLKSVAIAYPRRLAADSRDFQRRTLVTLAENRYTNAVHDADAYRTPLPAEQRSFEVRGLTPENCDRGATRPFRFGELSVEIALLEDACYDIPFDDWRYDGRIGRRLLAKSRTLYRSDALGELLPLGLLESMALPGESYRLAMPPRCLGEKLGADVAALAREGGYVDLGREGEWWAPSGRVYYVDESGPDPAHELRYAAAHFFTPRRYVDPFGNATRVRLDAHDLMPVETIDAVGNVTRAEIDYRVLAPRLQIEVNGNRSEAAFDALGLVAGTAVAGKDGEGDSLDGFDPDLDPQTLREFLDDPRRASHRVLGHATTRVLYEADRYRHSGKPAFGATILRETHVSDLAEGERTRTQVHVAFSDGFGREIQKKLQAEPGPVRPGGTTVAQRWIGSGWTIYNNKGKPVRKYEPFFSAVPEFEFAAIQGVSPILLYDPLARVVATLRPDHTFEKVVFDAWQQVKWDANDAVRLNPKTDPDIGASASRLPDEDYLPTWYAMRVAGTLGDAEKNAALSAARDADTPTVIHLDPLGRPVLSVVDNGLDDERRPRKYASLTVLDIQGNTRDTIDALGRSVMRYDYDLIGRRVHQSSMEAGERWTLNDAEGKPIRGWSSRLFAFRTEYDALRRPVRQYVDGGDQYERNAGAHPCNLLYEKTIYGDSADTGMTEHRQRAANLRGRVFRHFDTSGVTTTERYDFKGNPVETARQFAREYRSAPDWSKTPAFESARFTGRTAYDALNRVVTNTGPDGSIYRPAYNDAAMIERIDVALRARHCKGSPPWTPFVRNIDYNARGQRICIDYGNGASSTSDYDPLTFRLRRLRTTRVTDREPLANAIFADPACIQDLRYHYDPVGNIAEILDRALQTVFHGNQRVDATCRYAYDPLYRLTAATGREHVLQSAFQFAPADGDYRDYPFAGAASSGDLQSLETYAERYEYDPVGNIVCTAHRSAHNDWTRRYAYDEASLIEPDRCSNRLSRTHLGAKAGAPIEIYLYDASGNIVQMPHLPTMRWDFLDRMTASARQVVDCGTPETTYYVYDSSGARTRKVTERANGSRKSERLYIGGFELFREYAADGEELALERETLHVMDDPQRVAIVETLTFDRGDPLLSSMPRQRFQLAHHLGSASIELDEAAGLISYEEYSPYGTTVFQTGRNASEVKLKRYRYTSKERDEENGFNYHGARYYAPWLGRWISVDPSGVDDGPCVYAYVSGNPVRLVDPSGSAGAPPGALGYVAPWYQQINPRRLFGQIVTEAEHVIPRGVLKQLLYNPATKESEYTLARYLKDPTVIVERATALMKTHPSRGIAAADNARTAAAKALVASGKGVDLGREIEAAVDTTKAAISGTGSIVSEGQVGEAILGQVGNLFAMQRLGDTAVKLKEFEDATRLAKSAETLGTGLKSVPKVGPIGTGLAVLGLVLTVGVSSAQAATRPTATTTLDKIEHTTENVRSAVDIGGAVMSLHPTGGLIVLGATSTTLVAEKGIEVTGGDKRIVENAQAVESFAKSHGATDDQAQIAGAVTAGASGIAEGVTVIGDLAMGPIGWAHLGYRAYTNRK